jgi:hypothetical protein
LKSRVIVSLLLLAACSGKTETSLSPLSVYEIPDKLTSCPNGNKRPADLPAIRLPEELEANRQAFIAWGTTEDQVGRVCKSRLRELGDLYRRTVADLLQQIKGQKP